jgi:hypothetical protein
MKTMAAYNIGQYQAVVLALRVHASMVEQVLSGSSGWSDAVRP